MSTVRYAVLSCTVRYDTESLNIHTVLSFLFKLLIETKIYTQTHTHTHKHTQIDSLKHTHTHKHMIVTLWYGTVRSIRRTEEEKYSRVRTFR